MPPRRGRSWIARQVDGESRAPGSDKDIEQPSIPFRRRTRQMEVEDVTRQIGSACETRTCYRSDVDRDRTSCESMCLE
ncbi:hypothetical protein F511_02982 [Dorcoceras hygrometricum]|uniref:Uncharacterized protein n=1 Tax=Dorcoceras hygrometricum TaxID=472368 RepID=A0A2Z7A6F8_9LAMI|nr:hypothetical protein F511_02982 [Dorcoceras hygrometricum]